MAGNKADEKAKTEAPKTAAKAAPAQKFVHILTLGHGAATRNVQLITDSPKAPKVFEEFITGFCSGRTDLIWTPTPKDPVFAIRMSAIDFYEYRVQKAVAAQPRFRLRLRRLRKRPLPRSNPGFGKFPCKSRFRYAGAAFPIIWSVSGEMEEELKRIGRQARPPSHPAGQAAGKFPIAGGEAAGADIARCAGRNLFRGVQKNSGESRGSESRSSDGRRYQGCGFAARELARGYPLRRESGLWNHRELESGEAGGVSLEEFQRAARLGPRPECERDPGRRPNSLYGVSGGRSRRAAVWCLLRRPRI